MKRDVLLLRIYAFVFFMGVGTFFPYVYLYMRDLGFSNSQVGILAALGPAVMMVVQPFWGWITDLTGRPDRISMILALGVAGTVTLLLTGQTFPMVVLYMILFNIFYSSIIPIFDSITLNTLEKNSKVSYGQVRYLGSISFALTAFIVGWIVEQTHISIALWNFVGIALIVALIAIRLPAKRKVGSSQNLKIWPLFKSKELLVFLVAGSLVIGSHAINYTFLPFLMTEIGGSEGVLGMAMMISAFSEIPFFFFSSYLIRKYRLRSLLLIAFAATGLRWYLYSIAVTPNQLLLLQLLHSITFGLMYSSAVIYVGQLTPKHLQASGQNLFWAVTYGFGNVIANLVGGWVSEYYSVQATFKVAAVAAVIGTLIMLFGLPFVQRMKSSQYQ